MTSPVAKSLQLSAANRINSKSHVCIANRSQKLQDRFGSSQRGPSLIQALSHQVLFLLKKWRKVKVEQARSREQEFRSTVEFTNEWAGTHTRRKYPCEKRLPWRRTRWPSWWHNPIWPASPKKTWHKDLLQVGEEHRNSSRVARSVRSAFKTLTCRTCWVRQRLIHPLNSVSSFVQQGGENSSYGKREALMMIAQAWLVMGPPPGDWVNTFPLICISPTTPL